MEIFERVEASKPEKERVPLSARVYPEDWDEVLGQDHLLGPGRPLRRLIEEGKLVSAVFYGPPGTGKTAVARILSRKISVPFLALNASLAKPSDLKKLIQQALHVYERRGVRPVLYVEEVHRFNRLHQEILLSATEQGAVVFVGSTVMNPYFYLSKALLSRALVFEFRPLKEEHLLALVARVLAKEYPDREVPEEVRTAIARHADGDARRALNLLEAVLVACPDRRVAPECAASVLGHRVLRYDQKGDDHYDVISALIKSIRGSDPDAAMYWLIRMLESGEDPRFLLRRLMILAAEDIGLADPRALVIATQGAEAFDRVGRPEADLILTEVVLYLATAPKSNTVLRALVRAKEAVEKGPWAEVPDHLKDAHYPGAEALGRGKGYIYPHDHEGPIEQAYLPPELQGLKIFEPKPIGEEARLVQNKEVKK